MIINPDHTVIFNQLLSIVSYSANKLLVCYTCQYILKYFLNYIHCPLTLNFFVSLRVICVFFSLQTMAAILVTTTSDGVLVVLIPLVTPAF